MGIMLTPTSWDFTEGESTAVCEVLSTVPGTWQIFLKKKAGIIWWGGEWGTMRNDLHLLQDPRAGVQQDMQLQPPRRPRSGCWTERCWGMEEKSTGWGAQRMGPAPSSTTKEPGFCASHRFLPSLFSQLRNNGHLGLKFKWSSLCSWNWLSPWLIRAEGAIQGHQD